jgi:putative ABC transport system substrate-binding protein
MHPELSRKQLQFLKECVPAASPIAVLWNITVLTKASDWEELRPVAQTLGVVLQSYEVRGPSDFEKVFSAIAIQRPDALLTLGDPLTYHFRAAIANFASAQRLPAIYPYREFVDAGGLMSYGVDHFDLICRAAGIVDKVLKGAKPDALPVQQPVEFELVINQRAANALGLIISPALLATADEVIE